MTNIAPHTRANAKRLRAAQTPQERLVWAGLRDMNRAFGSHFRRQATIGPFIADFADYTRRLVIEIDGGQHGGDADAARDAYLAGQGFAVLRFWNNDVSGNLDGVLQMVMDAVLAAPPPQPSPTGGEEEAGFTSAELVADGGARPPQPSPTGGEGEARFSSGELVAVGGAPPPQSAPTGGEGEAGFTSDEVVADGGTPPPQPSPTRGEGAVRIYGVARAAGIGASPPPGGEGAGVGGQRTLQKGHTP